MDSDTEDDILEDDLLTAQIDVWDEELNDDLLRSDEEELTTRCPAVNVLPATDLTSSCDPCGPSEERDFVANEKILGQREHVFDEDEDEDEAPQVAERIPRRGFAGEQQAGEEQDHGEVLDVQINDPEPPREPVRLQEEDSASEIRAGETSVFDTERRAAAAVKRSPELCEEARPAASRISVNELGRPDGGGPQVDVQLCPCGGGSSLTAQRGPLLQGNRICGENRLYSHQLTSLSVRTPQETPQHRHTEVHSTDQSPFPSLPLRMGGLPSDGVSPQQVSLTSPQSPASPAVDPSSLQAVTDPSRLLHVQTSSAGIHAGFPGQHMFGQQLPTSELDSRPVLHCPVPVGAPLRPDCRRDRRRPHRSPQRNLDSPSPEKPYPASPLVPGITSTQSASSSSGHSARQEEVSLVPLRPQQCRNQHFLPNPNLPLSLPDPLTKLHPEPQPFTGPAPATPPHCPNSESQSSHQSRPAPLCCAVVRPRMQVQVPPHRRRALKDPPVPANSSSFITADRPTPPPAAQVRPVARAVATGMPGAARQRASARAGACARTVPEPVLAGKSRGQEVKEELHSPLSLVSKKELKRRDGAGSLCQRRDGAGSLCQRRDGEGSLCQRRDGEGSLCQRRDGEGSLCQRRDGEGSLCQRRDGEGSLCQRRDGEGSLCRSDAGEEEGGVPGWYRLQLEKQKRLRENLVNLKEKRRHQQARLRRKQRQERLRKVDMMPQRGPQPSQVNKQAQSVQTSRPSNSHLPQSHPDLQQQQQYGYESPPPLKSSSKPGQPRAPVARCPAAAPARRVVLWHGPSFYAQGSVGHDEGSGGVSGDLGEEHGRMRTTAMKRVMKESKVRVVKRSRMEEGGARLRSPAELNKGSRVVTFTQTPFCGPLAVRQVCPNRRRSAGANQPHDKDLRFRSSERTGPDQHQPHRRV